MPGMKDSEDGASPELKEKLEQLEDKVERPSQITRIKRLQNLQERLEGAHKIDKLKKLEKKVLFTQLIGIILFFPAIMYLNGVSLDDLYFPLYHSFLMVLIWTLILSLQLFIFKIIEIRRHGSYSAKRMLARKSIKKAVVVVIVALIILVAVYTPFMIDKINEISSTEKTINLDRGENKEIDFTNKGRLDFRVLKNITIDPHGSNVTFNIFYKNEEAENSIREDEINNTTTLKDLPTNEFNELALRLNSSSSSQVTFSKTVEVSSQKRLAFKLLSFFYVAVFVEWATLLYPIKKKYTGVGAYH